jgi:2-oxoglutarate dehydrogenase complex dehydrogenase (E1) component-like enzyme
MEKVTAATETAVDEAALASAGVSLTAQGYDTFDKHYSSVDEMWQKVFASPTSAEHTQPQTVEGVQGVVCDKPVGSVGQWYRHGLEYWENAKGDGYNDVLGGLGYVHEIDVEDSEQFVQKLRKERGLIGQARAIGKLVR